MPVSTNNPAGRLYAVLDKAGSVDEKKKTYVAWREILDADPRSATDFFHRVSLVHRLIADIVQSVRKIDALDDKLYLRHLPTVSAALGPDRFSQPWNDTKSLLSDTVMTSLEFCADALAQHPQPHEVDTGQLQELYSNVEELIRDVLKSKLDYALKQFLVRHLELVRSAILHYPIRGPAALRETLEQMAGAVVMNWDAVEKSKEVPEVSRFGKVFSHLQKLVQTAFQLKQLGETVTKLLPPGFGS